MAYRSSATELPLRGSERWDRDRFTYERERDRQGDERERFEDRDEFYSRGPPGGRVRETTTVDDRFERRTSRQHDDGFIRDRRYYEDEPRPRRSPPAEIERQVIIEKEREYRSPSPPRRPGALLRRQSSLDTFDRRPPPRFYEREEYPAPVRRGDYRPDPYQPIPLPRSRALPPPRVYAERDFEEIRVAEPDRYGDDEYHGYPERIREREVTRTTRRRERSGSRTSRSHTHHGSSVRSSSKTSTTTSTSSSSATGTVKSEYPKKGKTRIPARLVSKRALIDLSYPFEEEVSNFNTILLRVKYNLTNTVQGNTIIVQKALGQENIDDLLKLSEDYKKAELEVAAARSEAGNIIEERHTEIFTVPPPPPPAPATVVHTVAHSTAPPALAQYDVVNTTTLVRDVSPVRSHRSYSTSTTSRTPLIIEAQQREYSGEIPVGPLALIAADRRRDDKSIKAEIARLQAERELIRQERHHHHHHSHSPGGELVRAERLSSGELVLYEERVERIEEPRRGVRIEKDKKGRMSISVPKR
jgi:hypothetical protein